MTKSFIFTLLLSVLAVPAMAQTANPATTALPELNAAGNPAASTLSATSAATAPSAAGMATATALPTVTKEVPTASGMMTTATTPVAVTGGTGPGGAVISTQTTVTPTDGMVPADIAPTPIIGAGAPAMATTAMPVTTPAPDNSGNPLCATVHTPSADVAASPAPVAVGTPRMIPLSVDLAGALGIKGFENIVSEGPIGFVTINDQGKVFFEGQDLSTNVANMCAGGNIPSVPAGIKAPMTSEKAPDGSAYSAGLPGQTGFRMQPIMDGPSYLHAPKKKKAAPKKAEVKKEELPEVKAEDTTSDTTATDTSAMPSTTESDDLGSMMRTAPATTDTVPMAPKPAEGTDPLSSADDAAKTTTMSADEAAGLPVESETGAAVSEVLGTPASDPANVTSGSGTTAPASAAH